MAIYKRQPSLLLRQTAALQDLLTLGAAKVWELKYPKICQMEVIG